MARRVEVALVARVSVMHRRTPPSRPKVCKVFETKDIRLDFDLTSYAKSKSPALAGLGFFSDLSISAVSRVSMTGSVSSCRQFTHSSRRVESPLFSLRTRIAVDNCLLSEDFPFRNVKRPT